jgi:hypothetical protein
MRSTRTNLAAALAALICCEALMCCAPAYAQSATVQLPSPTGTLSFQPTYPDAITCQVRSPHGIIYSVIFYKSQTISFPSEPNNAAEYGTTFIRSADQFDGSVLDKWRLQLAKPGNIALLTIPEGWTTNNCPVGKTIANLIADKQALKLFTAQ